MPQSRKIDVSLLFKLWNSPASNEEIMESLGIRYGTLWSLKQRHKLPSRARRPGICKDDPDPETIAARAAEIRKTWSAEEENRRRVGWQRHRVEIAAYRNDGRQVAFLY